MADRDECQRSQGILKGLIGTVGEEPQGIVR